MSYNQIDAQSTKQKTMIILHLWFPQFLSTITYFAQYLQLLMVCQSLLGYEKVQEQNFHIKME